MIQIKLNCADNTDAEKTTIAFLSLDPKPISEGEEASLPCRVKNLFQHYTVINLIQMNYLCVCIKCASGGVGGGAEWRSHSKFWDTGELGIGELVSAKETFYCDQFSVIFSSNL